jgi:hypothetical protein
MMESLQGKLVPVRLLSDQQVKRRRKFTIYAGSLARTLGTPISGDPPVIDIKPVWPAITAFSVPICELIPEPPWEDLHATIIAGALRGSEVTILNKTSDVWGVRVDHGDVVHVKPAFLVAARLPI